LLHYVRNDLLVIASPKDEAIQIIHFHIKNYTPYSQIGNWPILLISNDIHPLLRPITWHPFCIVFMLCKGVVMKSLEERGVMRYLISWLLSGVIFFTLVAWLLI